MQFPGTKKTHYIIYYYIIIIVSFGSVSLERRTSDSEGHLIWHRTGRAGIYCGAHWYRFHLIWLLVGLESRMLGMPHLTCAKPDQCDSPSTDSTAVLGGVSASPGRRTRSRGRPKGSKDTKARATRSDSWFTEKKDANGNRISDPRQPSLFDIGVVSDRPRSVASVVPTVAEAKGDGGPSIRQVVPFCFLNVRTKSAN